MRGVRGAQQAALAGQVMPLQRLGAVVGS